MSVTAVAVFGSAIIGAAASNSAAKKQSNSAKNALNSTNKMAASSRQSAIDLFDNARKVNRQGQQAALEFYQNNARARIAPRVQGNMLAQRTLGIGAQQANNAILGTPVDMSFAQPQQVQANYAGIEGAVMPKQGDLPGNVKTSDQLKAEADAAAAIEAAKSPEQRAAEAAANQQQKQPSFIDKMSGLDGGIGRKTAEFTSGITGLNHTKKLLKKIF